MAFAGFLVAGPDCPDCCEPCIIAEDDFNRANETPVDDPPWSLIDGDGSEGSLPDLSGNKLVFASPGWIKHGTVDPRGAGENVEVEADFIVTSYAEFGLAIGILEGASPFGDQFYGAVVRWEEGECAYLVLGQRLGATYLFTQNPSNPGAIPLKNFAAGTYKLYLCLKPNQGSYGYESYDLLRAKITYPDGTVYGTSNVFDNAAGDGDKAGILVTVGAVDVDNFKYKYFRESPDHRTCPNCNTPCNIIGGKPEGKDSFDDDTACWWYPLAGSYVIADGVMTITDDDSEIQFQLPHPQLKTVLIASGRLSPNGIIHRVKLGSGYMEFEGDEIRAYDADGDLLMTVVDTNGDLQPDGDGLLDFTVCYTEDGVFSAYVSDQIGNSICADGEVDEVETGIYASLGGDDGAIFDDFVLKKARSTEEPTDGNCQECGCSNVCEQCENLESPSFMKAVLPVEIDACLAFCGTASGTWILDNIDTLGTINPCGYVNELISGCRLFVFFYGPNQGYLNGDPAPATYRVVIEYQENSLGGLTVRWELDFGEDGPITCMDFLDTPIPWKDTPTGTAGPGCIGDPFPDAYLTSLA